MYAYRHHLLPRLKGPGEATTVLTSPLPLPWRSVIGEATRNGSTPKMVGHGWFPKIVMVNPIQMDDDLGVPPSQKGNTWKHP